ncbi:MAG: AsmA family protein [Arenicellales bacterium]
MAMLKKIFTGMIVAVVFLAAAVFAIEAALNSSAAKSEIEYTLNKTFGMKIHTAGHLKLRFTPSFAIVAEEVKIDIAKHNLATIDAVYFDLRLIDIIKGNPYLDSISLDQPSVTLNSEIISMLSRASDNTNNEPLPLKSLIIDTCQIRNGRFRYSEDDAAVDLRRIELKTGKITAISNHKLVVSGPKQIFKAITFYGGLSESSIMLEDLELENISVKAEKTDEVLKFNPLQMEYFGEPALISGELKATDEEFHIRSRGAISELNLGRFIKRTEDKDIVTGNLQVHGELSTQGKSLADMLHNIDGGFEIAGYDLTLKGIDLDKTFDEFNKMKKISTSDVITLLTVGPLFSMFNHGYNQLDILKNILEVKGDSTIAEVKSKWKLGDGVATTEDVAFVTRQHRIALSGSIDYIGERYMGLTMATIDTEGCIINSETINGTFNEPVIKELGFFNRMVVQPLKRKYIPACSLFYQGSVEQPEQQRQLNENKNIKNLKQDNSPDLNEENLY